ncbi:MAG TPA: hypothetical protein VJR50_26520 [Mycobacterium sp.]|jgi:hypothetical protein|nr:hypothetical protein [Mycobacterium sp.]
MDPSERIPHDDWADQDLLTRDEAAERLVAEIADVTAKIEAGEGDELMERRLAGMKEALEHYRNR